MNRTALFLAFLISISMFFAAPTLAIENEDEAPAAFVEGASNYAIPFLLKMHDKLKSHFSKKDLSDFVVATGELTEKNARVMKRIEILRSKKSFLQKKRCGVRCLPRFT